MGSRNRHKKNNNPPKQPVLERDLDGIVGYDKMEETHKELGLKINEIYCGYLRQPITEHRDYGVIIISGYCSLTNRMCAKIPECGWDNDKCKYHNNKFGELNGTN